METGVATVGLDIAMNVFQAHGADANGATLFNRKVRRADLLGFFRKLPTCIVGLEACSTAHYWARSIATCGHDVRLIHPNYVRPFVKRGKTDATDAEAINEALTRKTMQFVSLKSLEQQAGSIVFRTRALFVRQRTQVTNALRGQLAELGFITRRGKAGINALAASAIDAVDSGVPASARLVFRELMLQIQHLDKTIAQLDKQIVALSRDDEDAQRLMTIPGVGPVIAAAIRSHVADPGSFRSSRHFAAWVGLTPKAHSSGGRHSVGHISKMGNTYLRSLLVVSAMTRLGALKPDDNNMPWLKRLKARRPFKVAAVALANWMARVIWSVLVKGGVYNVPGDRACPPHPT